MSPTRASSWPLLAAVCTPGPDAAAEAGHWAARPGRPPPTDRAGTRPARRNDASRKRWTDGADLVRRQTPRRLPTQMQRGSAQRHDAGNRVTRCSHARSSSPGATGRRRYRSVPGRPRCAGDPARWGDPSRSGAGCTPAGVVPAGPRPKRSLRPISFMSRSKSSATTDPGSSSGTCVDSVRSGSTPGRRHCLVRDVRARTTRQRAGHEGRCRVRPRFTSSYSPRIRQDFPVPVFAAPRRPGGILAVWRSARH